MSADIECNADEAQSRLDKLLAQMMSAICIVATVATALKSTEECSEERHALKTAVEMLYTAHSEIDADVMEVRHAHEAGSAGEVLQ